MYPLCSIWIEGFAVFIQGLILGVGVGESSISGLKLSFLLFPPLFSRKTSLSKFLRDDGGGGGKVNKHSESLYIWNAFILC